MRNIHRIRHRLFLFDSKCKGELLYGVRAKIRSDIIVTLCSFGRRPERNEFDGKNLGLHTPIKHRESSSNKEEYKKVIRTIKPGIVLSNMVSQSRPNSIINLYNRSYILLHTYIGTSERKCKEEIYRVICCV